MTEQFVMSLGVINLIILIMAIGCFTQAVYVFHLVVIFGFLTLKLSCLSHNKDRNYRCQFY